MHSSIDHPDLGRLTHRGRSRNWSGSALLPGRPEPVPLSISGTAEGPDPQQVQALKAFSAAGADWSEAAIPGLAELLEACGLPADNPWRDFVVDGVMIPGAGYHPSGEIYVLVMLSHVTVSDDADFFPAIAVVDGSVREILPGT